ncbi:cell wall-binding repeat-containing protein [Leifsonia sp. NPDC058292]|uniref:cell wall-binding repeat-containing protein n=1 Tax=Leifsonia sp. NPDC058292 TaxID=3346428 RepID=UPI0036D8685D
MNKPQRPRSATKKALSGLAASAVIVLGGALIPQAATAAPLHTLSGTVHYGVSDSSASHAATVSVYSLTGNGGEGRQVSRTISDGVSGAWSIAGVPSGRYRVQVDPSDYDHAANGATWYGDTPYEDEATVVPVTADVSGLDIDQTIAGSISGTVNVPSGAAFDPSAFQAYLYNPTTGLFESAKGVSGANVTSTGNYTISGLTPGRYVVRFADSDSWSPSVATQYFDGKPELWNSTLVTVTAAQNTTGINGSLGEWSWYSGRLSGVDRFGTAAAISQAFFGQTHPDVVYIANGLSYPDALSASAAAAWEGGPLLLVTPTSVPTSVVSELQRMQPSRIVVVGGTGAVSDTVLNSLKQFAGEVDRVSGIDRYATSLAISKYAFPPSRNSVFLATGANYPDALVAGSAAGYQGSPLILVKGTAATLDDATKTEIERLTPLRNYIVGGTGSVSAGVQNSVEQLPGATTVLRLGGIDRYHTAQAVNGEVFPFADTAYMANGLGFADALAVSAVAGVNGAPLLLSTYACMPYDEEVQSADMGVSTYWTVGGTAALSTDVENLTYCNPPLSASSAPLTDRSLPSRESVGEAIIGDTHSGSDLGAVHATRK